MPNEAVEVSGGYTGFDPVDYQTVCAGCGKTVNLLETFLRVSAQVERDIPYFQPELYEGADRGRLSGREEGGIVHDWKCLVALASSKEKAQGMKMFVQTEE